MSQGKTHDHAEMTRLVGLFVERGFELTDWRVTPLHVDVDGANAFVRYIEDERIKTPDGVEEWSRYHFAAMLVKENAG